MNEYIGSLVAGGGGSGSDPSAMHYMGPAASAQDLPSSGNNPGDTYKASANFTITQGEPAQTINVEAGDSIVWDGAIWDVYQGNIDGAVTGPSSATDGHLAVFDGVSGKVIKDGGALPDKWEVRNFGLATMNPSRNADFIHFKLFKNNVEYTSRIYVKFQHLRSEGPQGITEGAVDYSFREYKKSNLNDWWNSANAEAPIINMLIYEDSNYANFLCMINIDKISNTIVEGGYYASSKAVYDYSEAKANKVTSITNQSTDTQYPSALAVKNYVDNNGFNPANMESVSDPVTLNTPQADWNQADSTAPDYIKNKPTVDSPYTINWWFYKTANMLEIKMYKDGVEYTEPVYIKGIGSDGINTTTNGGLTVSQISGYYKPPLSSIKGDKAFCNVQIFKDSTCSYLMGQFTIVPQGSIADNNGNYVTGDQVYDYVSTQVGNIETLLAQI